MFIASRTRVRRHFNARRQTPDARRQTPDARRQDSIHIYISFLSLILVGNERSWFRRAWFATLFSVILVSGCSSRVGLAEHSSRDQATSLPPTLLQPSIARIDLGTIAHGGLRETGVWLCNNGAKTVEVTEIRTSCECFRVTLEKKAIAPGERIRASLKVDFADEPNFTGQLDLRADGVAKAETDPAFVLCVDVMVK